MRDHLYVRRLRGLLNADYVNREGLWGARRKQGDLCRVGSCGNDCTGRTVAYHNHYDSLTGSGGSRPGEIARNRTANKPGVAVEAYL
jgi:hypothetical protein